MNNSGHGGHRAHGSFERLGAEVDSLAPLWRSIVGWMVPALLASVIGFMVYTNSQISSLRTELTAIGGEVQGLDRLRLVNREDVAQRLQEVRLELRDTRIDLRNTNTALESVNLKLERLNAQHR